MRKCVALALLLLSFTVFAQEKVDAREYDSIANRDSPVRLFIAAGPSFSEGFEINKFLHQAGIVQMQTTELNLMAGLGYFDRYIDIDLAYEANVNGKSDNVTRYKTNTNGIKLRAHYQVLSFKKFGFGAGFNLGYSRRRLELFWKDQEVDFNADVSGNQLTLTHDDGYIGPSIYFKLKQRGRRNLGQTKLTLAYELGFGNTDWKAGYFNLQNRINEQRRQLVLNLAVYL